MLSLILLDKFTSCITFEMMRLIILLTIMSFLVNYTSSVVAQTETNVGDSITIAEFRCNARTRLSYVYIDKKLFKIVEWYESGSMKGCFQLTRNEKKIVAWKFFKDSGGFNEKLVIQCEGRFLFPKSYNKEEYEFYKWKRCYIEP